MSTRAVDKIKFENEKSLRASYKRLPRLIIEAGTLISGSPAPIKVKKTRGKMWKVYSHGIRKTKVFRTKKEAFEYAYKKASMWRLKK